MAPVFSSPVLNFIESTLQVIIRKLTHQYTYFMGKSVCVCVCVCVCMHKLRYVGRVSPSAFHFYFFFSSFDP